MKHFYIISNAYKDKGLHVTKKMKQYIEEKGGCCGYYATFPGEEGKKLIDPAAIPEDTECIFVLGGDGTVIRAARDLIGRHVPFIGVNMGTLGYLCELKETTVLDAIDQILEGHYVLEERMMLCGRKICTENGIQATALNDIVIHRASSLQIAKLIVSVNGKYLATYYADGIIVATPTGSTGYSMSAGGPIVEPQAKMFLITPISPHALNAKSIVLGAQDVITIELGRRGNQEETAVVSVDGDSTFQLAVGDKIEISQAEQKTNILKLTSQSFLELLQKKMQVYS